MLNSISYFIELLLFDFEAIEIDTATIGHRTKAIFGSPLLYAVVKKLSKVFSRLLMVEHGMVLRNRVVNPRDNFTLEEVTKDHNYLAYVVIDNQVYEIYSFIRHLDSREEQNEWNERVGQDVSHFYHNDITYESQVRLEKYWVGALAPEEKRKLKMMGKQKKEKPYVEFDPDVPSCSFWEWMEQNSHGSAIHQ